jgi:adenosine/AMP kinase
MICGDSTKLYTRFSKHLRYPVRVLNAVLHKQSVAVIFSVDIDTAEVELEVALSTALLVCCKVDCVDIRIPTDIAIVVSTAPLPLSRLAGLAYVVPGT